MGCRCRGGGGADCHFCVGRISFGGGRESDQGLWIGDGSGRGEKTLDRVVIKSQTT